LFAKAFGLAMMQQTLFNKSQEDQMVRIFDTNDDESKFVGGIKKTFWELPIYSHLDVL
jgi:hypothetical protein